MDIYREKVKMTFGFVLYLTDWLPLKYKGILLDHARDYCRDCIGSGTREENDIVTYEYLETRHKIYERELLD